MFTCTHLHSMPPSLVPPQPTVPRAFHLSTSKRAEWDSNRAGEEARLSTEERTAKKVRRPGPCLPMPGPCHGQAVLA